MTQTFDALEIDINTQTGGTHLIEASAGTGKTFGIASLFTRLIVLENIKIEKIAVLTFTKAATAELKTRLRSRLVSVRSFLENNQQTEDKFLQDLFAKAKEIDKIELLKRTKTALNDFDQAGIYTIHAFCRSILNENAFDCRVPFALEMQSTDDDNELKQKLAEDFWRKKIANNQTAALICFNNEITPEKILDDIKSYISQPLLNKENISFETNILIFMLIYDLDRGDSMKILSVNAGSSSLKFRLYDMPKEELLMKGIIERIGLSDGVYSIRIGDTKV
ncbi:MAG: UvrD-helicase domain-containing protein, partial [Neisseriaceae bacterium]|nr:UvrD-helicase domain-containing protein [Neisseriaceae bacterium]